MSALDTSKGKGLVRGARGAEVKEGSVFQIAKANWKSRERGNGWLTACCAGFGKLFLALDSRLLYALHT